MALINRVGYNSRLFDFNPIDRTVFIGRSMLRGSVTEQLYDDACDCGLAITSHNR